MSDYWVNVDTVTLGNFITTWREQSDRLSGAAKTMGSATATGFGEGVARDVDAFVTSWEPIVNTTQRSAQDLMVGLEESLDILQRADVNAGIEISGLMGGGV